MRFAAMLVVCLFTFMAFLFSGVIASAEQATADMKKPVEQCVKGGKPLPAAKTKDQCIKEGGTWVRVRAKEIPSDQLKKSKAEPPDPSDKSKAMPDDPFGKGKAKPTEPVGKTVQ